MNFSAFLAAPRLGVSAEVILATSGRAELRNGAEALDWAKRCAEATDHRQPGVLLTLAAAEAEVGNFKEAIRWQTKAIELLPDPAKQRLRPVLELYQAGKPLRRNDER